MAKVTIVGLGEAGKIYAQGLLKFGHKVTGYDPFAQVQIDGFIQKETLSEALQEAEFVISLVGAKAASAVSQDILKHLNKNAIIADFNTSSPAQKKEIETWTTQSGALFVDVAVLAPVPRAGLLSPLMVSGTGAEAFTSFMKAMHVPIEWIDGPAGDAAARKLLRSVFMKGLAALVIESVTAAEVCDQTAWMRQQIASEIGDPDEKMITRLIEGTRQHAGRRHHEMENVKTFLDTLETPSWVTNGTLEWLRSLSV